MIDLGRLRALHAVAQYGSVNRAAEVLGIGERTLYRKIKEYRLPELEYSLD